MPYISEEEGKNIPVGLPPVVDAHVHVFPAGIFGAIWKWFDQNAWHIRYRLTSTQIIDFLLAKGINQIVALQYAHKPGLAAVLNSHMSEICANYGNQVTGMATVFPGEDDELAILQDAFDMGLQGLKLHAHVQCFDMNQDGMYSLYDCCQSNQKPIIMHVGREPKSMAYRCDPYSLCMSNKLENILRDFPGLKVCVPHLGFDELEEYRRLIEKYDNLWLDTAMVISDYFPINGKYSLHTYRTDRVMYGSDFPNIPYAWDRELKELDATEITYEARLRICSKNAADFFNIHLQP